MSKKIKIGVLGAGRIAKKSVIPALLSSRSAELVMIGSRKNEPSEFNVPVVSYQDVLESPEVEAVYISLPNSMHEEWAVKAAKAGKHIWCEKPAALTYASAEKMVAAVEKHSVRLMEGFMYRYHPQHKKVREILESGELGVVTRFEGRIAYPKPDDGNIRLKSELGGGFYFDALVYPISACRMLFAAEPRTIACDFVFDKGIDVQNNARLEFPDGREAEISGEFTEDYASTYKLTGTEGSLWMSRAYAVPKDMEVKVFVETRSKHEELTFAAYDHFAPMLEEFCTEVLSGVKTRDYEGELLKQAKVVDAGWRSAKTKKTVRIH